MNRMRVQRLKIDYCVLEIEKSSMYGHDGASSYKTHLILLLRLRRSSSSSIILHWALKLTREAQINLSLSGYSRWNTIPFLEFISLFKNIVKYIHYISLSHEAILLHLYCVHIQFFFVSRCGSNPEEEKSLQ